MPAAPKTDDTLKIPQARVLKALMPKDTARDLHYSEWPTLIRTKLAEKAGFNPTTGTINRVLHGIPQGSSSGEPHPGLLERGLLKLETLVLDSGATELHYRITAAGIKAYERYVRDNGDKLPKRRDKSLCVNERYQEA